MEKFFLHLVHCPLILLSLLFVSSFDFISASCSLYINCGSKSKIEVEGRTFVGDGHKSHSFFVGESKATRNSSVLAADTSPLYHTARIFNQQSYFELQNTSNGLYFVRLHFFPSIYGGTNLSEALFNVSTKIFLLFSARNTGDFEGIVKEYFINITDTKLRIHFVPAKATSVAFVNAIELIPLPQGFITDSSQAVPPLPNATGTFFLQSNAFQTIYRVNVGGPEVNTTDDSLSRHWIGDDQFLVSPASAKKCTPFPGRLGNPGSGPVVNNSAPATVYTTCKQMNSKSNITWHFNVKKQVMLYVRLHFCDFLSPALGNLKFNLYIYSNFRKLIDPSDTFITAAPFFTDFVVDSGDFGYINISVGPEDSSTTTDAFLNGVEIMEFVANTTKKFDENMYPHSSKHTGLIIGILVGIVALISISAVMLLFIARQRRAQCVQSMVLKNEIPQGRDGPHSWITAIRDSSASPLPNLNLKLRMPLSEILAATSNFDTKLLIGEGGFGKVYKGTLSDSRKVAVKRSDSSHGQGRPEFQTEVTVLSKIRHRHLVSLFGYCDEESEMILVYEFMEKGTLRDHLYIWKKNSHNAIPRLNWKQRLEICIGAAKGLHYLHTGSEGGIIHRDVKSTNILLGENYIAKVADFGLSQSGPPDPEHNWGLIGSFGYLDPEYVRTFQLTYKSDVYSFGVVLLEVLCARPPILDSSMREEINLAEWAMFWHRKGQLEKIVDPVLSGEINPNSLRQFAGIIERCLKTEGADRPTMLDVCWDLEYALQLQQTSVPREPHEDSTTDVSSNYLFLASSTHFPSEEDCNLDGGDDDELDSKLMFSRPRLNGP